MTRREASLLIALGLVHLTCHQAILTAPPGSSIFLSANPDFIPANGGVSIISALVLEPAGTPVPDGTTVQFFTNLGHIDEQGKTNDGVARVNLVSDTRSGTAFVRAFSGGTSSTGGGSTATTTPGSPTTTVASTPTNPQGGGVSVVIGSALPTAVFVVADPTRIRADDPRSSIITANVLDGSGNPVMNVPVFFTVEVPGTAPGPAPTEFMGSGGQPLFTDSNGQAKDTLFTRYGTAAAQKTVAVRATTANGKTSTTLVVIN